MSIAMPIFMGLGNLATQNGAFAGCLSGVLMIMLFGWTEFGTFMAGLEMLTLMAFGNIEPPEVGLGASRTCLIFVTLPIVTGSDVHRLMDGRCGPKASNLSKHCNRRA